MVKYYYNKYNAIENFVYTDNSSWRLESSSGKTVLFNTLRTSYTFDTKTNTYALSGNGFSGPITTGTIGYGGGGDSLDRYRALHDSGATSLTSTEWHRKLSISNNKTSTGYSRGTLVQSNIIAEDGTYPNDGRHTDGYWYVRGAVANKPPVITPDSIPSGVLAVKPTFGYVVSDPDNNAMTVTESIDGIVVNTRTSVASGTRLTFTPTDIVWLRTRINQTVNITIKADDGNGGVTTVNYPITRTTPAIDMQLKSPFSTDVAARRLLLKLEGNIPVDAVLNVQVCNNAFDASPTWENATNLVRSGFPYPFTNTTKTAAKWGVSFKVRVERGSSALPIYIDGVGGAFD